MKTIIRVLLVFVAVWFLTEPGSFALAQNGDSRPDNRRVVTAMRMEKGESIDLNGRLDEPIWKRATPAADFIQIDPQNGAPATEPTEVYIVFDSNRMYIGVICRDSEPGQLKGNTMLRDAVLTGDDRFQWVFDPYLDGTSGYFFEINPSGAMGDSTVTGRTQDRAWDGIWTARVSRSDIGWTAEIEMPFRTLNFDPQGANWGINFQRTVRRKGEDSIWNGSARNQTLQTMSNAGLVTGLSEISQGVGLAVRPYVVATATDAPGRTTKPDRYASDAGFDLIYNVTPKLRANFTVNTDFAETEVDDRIVNLTRFPTRYPEKREFFTEGGSYFRLASTGTVTFFSRRIGLNEGTPQRIDYGAKLTGKLGKEDIGFLQVRTGKEGSLLGEDFTVFRDKHHFLTDSYVGMIYTRRSVRESTLALGVPSKPDLHTIGLDYRMATRRFRGNKNLSWEGFFAHTTNPANTGKNDLYGLQIDYPNDVIIASIRMNEEQPNVDPAVGMIMRRSKDVTTSFQFRPRPRSNRWIRQFTFGSSLTRTANSANKLLTRDINLTLFQLATHSGDTVTIGLSPQYEFLDSDFPMDGGRIKLLKGTEYNFSQYSVNASTSNSRPIALRANFTGGNYFTGKRRDFGPGIAVRPLNGLVVDMSGQWNRIELREGSFSTSLIRTNISSQFSPWISLSSNIQYDTVSRGLGWQARFRWILKPGNDLFFVYTHNWQNDPAGLRTLDRKAASKFAYTYRF